MEKKRIAELDIIRGFALFGILLVNMKSFSYPGLETMMLPGTFWTDHISIITEKLIGIFAQANFYTLFSFLFGLGTMILIKNARSRIESFLVMIVRRLLVLLAFGVFHAFFIWSGDILITYALLGFILLLFHKASPKVLSITALLLMMVPGILFFFLLQAVSLLEPEAGTSVLLYDEAAVETALAVYQSGTYSEIFQHRLGEWQLVNNAANAPFLFIAVFPMFLLGAALGKSDLLLQVKEKAALFKLWMMIALIVGLPLKIIPYWGDMEYSYLFLGEQIGGPAMAIFYFFAILLLCQQPFFKRILTPLGNVGRMSITNYLTQSVICTMIFYSYGLGLYGSLGPIWTVLLAAVIFTIQIFLSRLWLQTFQYGPVEWIWRQLTYWRKLPIKRNKPVYRKL
ncbi:DUF418 domain-containing protein [Bacillus lacus]|uniref:DUF418 domain-containing protein n=1 Tax=Metabacillus lacus TaxID=1983721 RepID=A0A7X2LZF4_9BACI|nr:DUF418 domain-containing protein [Metabacillus lacus]MRX71644.1 DUF418 domain-containing protein [Metabacillus lacus]